MKCGFAEKDVLEKWVAGEEIPKPPQPKSPPPPPPSPEQIDDATARADWTTKYEAWSKENDHLPNLQPSNVIINRLKGGQQPAGAPGAPGGSLTPDDRARLSRLEQKVDKLINHLGVK